MFSKQHYVEIAKIVAKIDNPACRVNVWSDFDMLFEEDNPRFNSKAFMIACNVLNAPKSGNLKR